MIIVDFIVKTIAAPFKKILHLYNTLEFIDRVGQFLYMNNKMEEDQNKLLDELLRLSAEKEVPYTQAQLKKMTTERLVEVMNQYRLKEMDRMNEDLVDIALLKFEQVMKRFELIKHNSELAKNLQERKLLRKDLKNVISAITPLLPYVGLLEGIVVCTGEIYEKMVDFPNEENKNEDSSSKTEEGEKCDPSDPESTRSQE